MDQSSEALAAQIRGEVHEYLGSDPVHNVERFLISCTANYVIPRLSGQTALELGVGHGAWTAALLRQFERVTTIERAQDLLDSLSGSVDPKRWTGVCCSFEEFEPESKFDTVVATYVLEHILDAEGLLRQIRSWLAPGGKVAIAVPNALSIHRRLAAKMGLVKDPAELGEADRRVGHFHCFTPGRLENIIAGAGFRVVEHRGMLTKSLPSAYLTSCNEQQLRGLFDLGLDLPLELSAILYYLGEPAEDAKG
jgi:2-polyprenyl-3-methyl-5-hydroxy-6-metoxy-1,4-benzoquinol methylase